MNHLYSLQLFSTTDALCTHQYNLHATPHVFDGLTRWRHPETRPAAALPHPALTSHTNSAGTTHRCHTSRRSRPRIRCITSSSSPSGQVTVEQCLRNRQIPAI